MSIDAIWKPRGLVVETADISSTAIGGITTHNIQDALQVQRYHADGSPYPTKNVIQGSQESIRVSTVNPDAAINAFGMIGTCFKGTNAHTGFHFYLAQHDECALDPLSGSVHRSYGVSFSSGSTEQKGIINFESLNCQHQGDAVYSMRMTPTVDSGTFAIENGENVALPAGLGDNEFRYSLGPTRIAGQDLTGVKSVNISGGIGIGTESADSNVPVQFAFIQTIEPVIVIRGIDQNWLSGSTLARRFACTHANTRLILRRRSEDGSGDFESAGTTKHIVSTVKGVGAITTISSGPNTRATEQAITIWPEYTASGGVVPIVTLTSQSYVP